MAKIKMEKLNVAYGPHQILHDIDAEIPAKQVTAIIGPSGCGKTTLLKSLNRLIDLNEDLSVRGKVLINDVNIYTEGADIINLRKRVGFISQKPYPLPMSIYDNVAFGLRIHRMSKEQLAGQIEHLAEICPGDDINFHCDLSKAMGKKALMDIIVEGYLRLAGLWCEVKDRLSFPASMLSVGQQQRLALARALAVEPEVILADEPTSALDPISAQLIEKQFNLLKKDYTIVMVTHIMRQARRIADYVLFIYMGELLEHGPAEQVLNSPKDERTRAYVLGEIN